MSKKIVYVKDGCPYCAGLLKELKAQGEDFDKVNVSIDKGALKKVKEEYGARKVPVLVEGDSVTIGYDGQG